jgi:hypothetical protein
MDMLPKGDSLPRNSCYPTHESTEAAMARASVEGLVGTIRPRYLQGGRRVKPQILDESGAITGHHRKHAIRLLN